MTEAEVLGMLKIDLGFTSDTYDERLTAVINSAVAMMEREGASSIDFDSVEDVQLTIMYAGWLWRKRFNYEPMPRMLRWALNNRILGEKAKVDE